jgi:hypothetical protein
MVELGFTCLALLLVWARWKMIGFITTLILIVALYLTVGQAWAFGVALALALLALMEDLFDLS